MQNNIHLVYPKQHSQELLRQTSGVEGKAVFETPMSWLPAAMLVKQARDRKHKKYAELDTEGRAHLEQRAGCPQSLCEWKKGLKGQSEPVEDIRILLDMKLKDSILYNRVA